MSEDTIVALASPPGIGALGIIRVSGPATIAICDRIFKGKQVPSEARDRTALLGEIVSGDGFPIDQVLLTVMRGPHSVTGQDVASPGIPGALWGGLLAAGSVDPEVFRRIRG